MTTSKPIPSLPGVYLHKNNRGEIIYVGKAKNLKKRVASYFSKSDHDPKTTLLIKNIASTEFIVTNNELEALLLENRLIKKHKPKFNIELKDAARYCYIQVTREKFPRVFMTRRTNKKDRFFGPYTGSVAEITKMMRDLFKLRSCGPMMPRRTCIYYDLGLCSAPCEGKISEKAYEQSVDEALNLIKHGDSDVKRLYYDKMKEASEKKDFEKALQMRKRIELLDRLAQRQIVDLFGRRDQDAIGIATVGERPHVTVLKSKRGVIQSKDDFTFAYSKELLSEFLKAYYSTRPAPHDILVNAAFDPSIELYLRDIWKRAVSITRVTRGDKKDLVMLAQKNAYAAFNLDDPSLIAMKEALRLDAMPHVIDCFDISNIGEQIIVGACIQFKNKQPNKGQWRLYNIKGDFGQDDFRSMNEVIKRRYAKLPVPDLIIIDGGAIQVEFAVRALKELGLQCSVVGLAKKEERIVFPEGDTFKLPRREEYARLIMRIRDAVHNFAVGHSRRRYKADYKKSELDDIAGIGPSTKFKLLSTFGSLDAVKKASIEELAAVVGKAKARLIVQALHA